MRDNKLVNEMCVAQKCCRMCPVGKASHRLALDCRQFMEIFPEATVKLAQRWEEEK